MRDGSTKEHSIRVSDSISPKMKKKAASSLAFCKALKASVVSYSWGLFLPGLHALLLPILAILQLQDKLAVRFASCPCPLQNYLPAVPLLL